MQNQVKLVTSHPSIEWTVYRGKTFSVTVKGWGTEGNWKWNVYAHIYDNHPLHSNHEWAMCLPFHKGCTFDAKITTEPLEGVQYDWQKIHHTVKVGGGGAHYMDCYEGCDPAHGIPPPIEWDAEELIKALLEGEQINQGENNE